MIESSSEENYQYELFDASYYASLNNKNKLSKKIDSQRLPTNTTTKNHSIHRWFNFIAGFSPEFVVDCFNNSHLNHNSVILDPFLGCGTTLVEANKYGYKSFGYEPNPFFFKISKAKLFTNNWEIDLNNLENTILDGFENPQKSSTLSESASKFLLKLFNSEILASLLGAKESISRSSFSDNYLAFLLLSKVLELSSHSQTDGIYKAPTSKKQAQDPKKALSFFINLLKDDILISNQNNYKSKLQIFEHSSESMSELENESISLIITSPPYLNNFDFAEMTRMYFYFWGIANSWAEITDKVRSKLIVNTTTALKGHKNKQNYYRQRITAQLHSKLDSLVVQLSNEKKTRAGRKPYDYLIYPYFAQMTTILNECYRVMKQGATLNMIVGDAALYGIHISSPQYLEIILEMIGFQNTQCQLMRTRGHRWILSKRDGSKIGLGEYLVTGTK